MNVANAINPTFINCIPVNQDYIPDLGMEIRTFNRLFCLPDTNPIVGLLRQRYLGQTFKPRPINIYGNVGKKELNSSNTVFWCFIPLSYQLIQLTYLFLKHAHTYISERHVFS
jgi:hypothetical protein